MVGFDISNIRSSSPVNRKIVLVHMFLEVDIRALLVYRSPAAAERAPSPCYSADSSDSSDTCSHASTPTSNALVLSLVVQVNALQESNKQLYQELQAMKAELETLKKSWQKLPPKYEPGMLSGMF